MPYCSFPVLRPVLDTNPNTVLDAIPVTVLHAFLNSDLQIVCFDRFISGMIVPRLFIPVVNDQKLFGGHDYISGHVIQRHVDVPSHLPT